MRKIIKNGTLINEGRIFKADIIIENDVISDITDHAPATLLEGAEITDAAGQFVIPGVIDDQVHFREPGLTRKGDISEGSKAAAAGGITSFMDMPNVVPPTTTLDLLKEKQELGHQKSLVNYSFYLGATSDNINEVRKADPHTTCGLKIFMGASTGNLLVDKPAVLEQLFAESPLLIATHCEDTPIINANLAAFKERYGEAIPPEAHPLIRSREACLKSSTLAAGLARKYGSRLHILHLSTKEEISLLDTGKLKDKKVTGEACVHHLYFNDTAYLTKGNFIKWNPAIKTENDRLALIEAVNKGNIDVVATDHAPHLKEEKSGIYTQAASGGPLVQHSLIVMLQLMEKGEIKPETIVERMCHAPAELFHIVGRGYLRKGYKADICIFEKHPWKVSPENILYKCQWSPLENEPFDYKVVTTFVNGKKVYDRGVFDDTVRGEMLTFN